MKPRRAGKPAVTPFRPSRGLVALTVAAALVSVFVAWSPGRAANAGPDAWTAVVLDETGRPVPQATLALGGQHLLADADGRVAAQLTEPALVHAAAPGHLPRVQAVEPGRPAAITLTRRTPAVVSLRFAGDAMFGRRFHEPGPAGTAPLTAESTAADHAALLAPVRPLLADADLTVVNLETPLVPDPWFDPDGVRPARFHQTKEVRDLMDSATRLGAQLVIGGHPHVVGGVTAREGAVLAESTGNLIFDQALWSTFPGHLLRVDLTAEQTRYATVDPILLDGYLPRPAVGAVADQTSRIAAGALDGPVRLGDGRAVLAPHTATTPVQATARPGAGHVRSLAPGWWLSTPDGARAGTDLLFGTGSLEPQDTDPDTGPGRLWAFGRNAEPSVDAACGPGSQAGLLIARSPNSRRNGWASTANRVPVKAGESLSLVADVRGASPGALLEVRWYDDYEGGSVGRPTVLRLPQTPDASADACTQVRLDVTVPQGVVAAQPYARLTVPDDRHLAAHLLVDNLRLVRWAPEGATGRRYDTLACEGDCRPAFTYDPAVVAGIDPGEPLLPTTGTP